MGALFEMIQRFGSFLEGVGTIFWLWMLIDCWNRAKARPKRGWLLFLLLCTHSIGALVYFFIYVYPITQWIPYIKKLVQQPLQKKASVYYTLPKQPSYQEYQQGYQPQSVSSSAPLSSNSPYQQQDQQQANSPITDYEEPYATYPEMPPQQQQ